MLVGGCRAHLPVTLTADAGLWTFDSPTDPLRPASGACVLEFRDPDSTRWYLKKTRVGRARSFGLPAIQGADPNVLSLPAASPSEGLTLFRPAPPSGSPAAISNYTLIIDVLVPPAGADRYAGLLQTDAANRKDANFFVKDRLHGGIGFGGVYHGTFRHGQWNRVAVAVRSASGLGGVGHVNQYIDGRFVGGANTPDAAPAEPWKIGPAFHLFTDNDGETAPVYVRSVYFIERALFDEEIAALGGPSAAGLPAPGPLPPPLAPVTSRRAHIVAHRGGCGSRPENTLAAIRHAFESGADHAEVDVQLSADGVAFLMHDETVDRTTDGRGKASELTMAELKRLDAGGRFDPRYRGERVPTLAEALKAAAGRGRLLLDVKDLEMGRAIRRALKEAGVGSEAIWLEQNSNRESLRNFREHLKNCEILWMDVPRNAGEDAFGELRDLGVVGFELEFGTFSKEFVDLAHRNGMKVYTFTIFDEQSLRAALDLGVDGFETDYPEYFDRSMPPRN